MYLRRSTDDCAHCERDVYLCNPYLFVGLILDSKLKHALPILDKLAYAQILSGHYLHNRCKDRAIMSTLGGLAGTWRRRGFGGVCETPRPPACA